MTEFAAAVEVIVRSRLADDPVRATWAGLHDYDAELPDLTADGIAQSRANLRADIARLADFTPGDFKPDERLDHRLLSAMLQVDLRERTELEPERHDPSVYPSIAADGVYSILARDFAPLEQRLPSVVARLRKVPGVFAAAMQNLERSPRVWTEIAIDETKGTFEFFNETVSPLLANSAEGRAALAAAMDAVRDYERFLKERHLQRDVMAFAVGRDFFDYKLHHEHFLAYTAATLVEFGEEAIRLTQFRLQEVAARIDPASTWDALIDTLRNDTPSESSLLDEYRRSLDQARRFVVDRKLATMPPGESLVIVETPIFVRPTIPYAAYMAPGMFDVRQQGLYYVTPLDADAPPQSRREQLLGHNRYGMLLTNVHEGYPGHHLQLVHANRAPSLVRRYCDSSVLCEGWALYCEQMVLDEGISTDLRVRLFQLKDQLWRACRVVIDAKLHTGEFTFEQAVDMLVNVAKLERVNAIGEVRRYTQSPTQPMSYLVGKHQILDLRERERQRLGQEFDLHAFHDRLLSYGSIPVPLIAESEGAA